MKITDLIPNVDDLQRFAPEELAGVLIEMFNSNRETQNQVNSSNVFSPEELSKYPRNRLEDAQKILMEGWWALEREGLIVPKPGPSYGWYYISRRGRTISSRKDYESFRLSRLFPKESIHPKLLSDVYPMFLRGQYETAIFQSFKIVEISVRDACPNIDSTLIGTHLMRIAFHPDTGPLSDLNEPKAEREALGNIFSGAIGRFKNPASHRQVSISSPSETIEIILLASHLLKIVDERRKFQTHPPKK